MTCPTCGHPMEDVTESWHTFAAAEGAEYLSTYVTIWRCQDCGTVAGGEGEEIEWVMQPQEAGADEE
jgi:uncharacterized Zn finger protein